MIFKNSVKSCHWKRGHGFIGDSVFFHSIITSSHCSLCEIFGETSWSILIKTHEINPCASVRCDSKGATEACAWLYSMTGVPRDSSLLAHFFLEHRGCWPLERFFWMKYRKITLSVKNYWYRCSDHKWEQFALLLNRTYEFFGTL